MKLPEPSGFARTSPTARICEHIEDASKGQSAHRPPPLDLRTLFDLPHERFPRVPARRFGEPLFTKHLGLWKEALDEFVEEPLELLCEIIRTLDAGSRSALASVFMRGGLLPSPVTMSPDEERAVALFGGSPADVRNALNSLHGSLVIQSLQAGGYVWKFKHPTVRDAFAALLAEDRELTDIYLTGTPVGKLFGEVSCGDVGLQGVKVIVPADRFEMFMTRLESIDTISHK